jgi:hypothetical protein
MVEGSSRRVSFRLCWMNESIEQALLPFPIPSSIVFSRIRAVPMARAREIEPFRKLTPINQWSICPSATQSRATFCFGSFRLPAI